MKPVARLVIVATLALVVLALARALTDRSPVPPGPAPFVAGGGQWDAFDADRLAAEAQERGELDY